MVKRLSGWREKLYIKLSHLSPLSESDFAAVDTLVWESKSYSRQQDIWGAPATMAVVAEGWCYRYRLLEDGRRMVFNYWLPGDLINLAPLSPGLHFRTATVGTAELVHFSATDFSEMCNATPELVTAFAASERLDGLLLANQVLRLGRLSAPERVAHLFLELWDRLRLVGLADSDRFALPITYGMLADTVGLSNVHVSRTMALLRENRMVGTDRRTIILNDPESLADLVEYDPIAKIDGEDAV